MQTRFHHVDQDLLIIEASEAINDDTTEPMINELEAEIASGKYPKIIVDFREVQFLSSFGLGMIMRLRSAAKQVKIDLKLSDVNPMIQELLRATRMDKHFMVYPDVELARASFHLRPM